VTCAQATFNPPHATQTSKRLNKLQNRMEKLLESRIVFLQGAHRAIGLDR
jgi:hypothetical protein